MNTFDRLQALFLSDLRELSSMQKRKWFMLPTTRTVREEHLGRCCYFAEEFLSPDDLRVLKQEIGLDEQQWRTYKARVSAQ